MRLVQFKRGICLGASRLKIRNEQATIIPTFQALVLQVEPFVQVHVLGHADLEVEKEGTDDDQRGQGD